MDRRIFFKNAVLTSTAGLAVAVASNAYSKPPSSAAPSGLANGYINVTDSDYGADSTGVTSSATAFALAASDASVQEKPLWIPAGTYSVQDMSALTENNLVIVGAGREVVTILGAATNAFISPAQDSTLILSGITATGFRRVVQHIADIDLKNIEITDCRFNNISQQVFGSGAGVDINTIEHFIFERNVVENIGFDNADSAVVKLSCAKCDQTIISNNLINVVGTTSKTNKSYAFFVKAAAASDESNVKTTITGNIIKEVRSGSLSDCVGILVLGGQAVISDNHLEDVASSDITTSDNEGIYTKCRNSVISGNTLINCGGREGVIICKGRNRYGVLGTSAYGYDNIISNNTIRQDTNLGFRTTGITITMDGCIAESNHISGTQYGVAVWPGVSNTIVKGNLIYGLIAYESQFSVLGISATSPNDISIIDNQITNSEGTGSVACYGILISSSGSSYSGCLIRGNWITKINPTTSSLSRGIAINLHIDDVCEKIIIESNHIDLVGRGIHGNNLDRANTSSVISNSVSNYELSSIAPSASGWSLFSNNLL